MAEIVTMALFCTALVACIAAGISIVPALAVGVLVFLIHGRLTGHAWKPMLRKGFTTMKAASIVIGLLTTLWRAAGTVPRSLWRTRRP